MERMSLGVLLFTLLLLSPHVVFATNGDHHVHEERKDKVVAKPNRYCAYPSQGYRGLCGGSYGCSQQCVAEGFDTGRCRGSLFLLRRRCYCLKDC